MNNKEFFNKIKSLGDGNYHCGGWWIFSKGWVLITTKDDESIALLFTTHEHYSTRMMGEEGHARVATYYSNGDIKYIGKQKQNIKIADDPEAVIKFLYRKMLLAIKVKG